MSHNTETRPKRKSGVYRQGIIVALVLAVLTIIQYFAALYLPNAIILMLLALAKGYLVVQYFMHISSLWSEGDH